MGAKHTATLIPLCHNITLSKVGVELRLAPEAHAVDIEATARCVGPTGVEMEALTAAAVRWGGTGGPGLGLGLGL